MDIDNALRRVYSSVGGFHVHVSTAEGSQIVVLQVGEKSVELNGINEVLAALDLLGRVVHETRRMVKNVEGRT